VAAANNIDLAKIYRTEDLVQGESVYFAATGLTDGEFLRGVRYLSGGATTHSVVMRSSSGTVRYIESRHHWNKLMRISGVDYTHT
jgi:fructose-1,6-bisphosphatase II